MATIRLSVEGTTVGTVEVADELAQDNSDRFMAWLAATYGTDAEGQPRTPAQMIGACWAGIRGGIFANIVAYERDVAAQAARDAVPPMESTTSVVE